MPNSDGITPSVVDEIELARSGAVMIDRSATGIICLSGSDRVTCLQGMVSNDLHKLNAGNHAISAFMLDATGHILADLRIVDRGENLLLDFDRRIVERVYSRMDGFVVIEDVEITEQSEFIACISIQGPNAKTALTCFESDAIVVGSNHTGFGGMDVYFRSTERENILDKIRNVGIHPISAKVREILRVSAGIPQFGIDFDETILAPETGLAASHISYSKGCYVGQEIVARIQSRGHTNRQFSGFVVSGNEEPVAGTRLYLGKDDETKDVGWITSSIYSPTLQKSLALGYVRTEASESGTILQLLQSNGENTATVTALPFS